ncbi:hypothetical protein CAI16_08025 [Virgibacillus dokdonensis]|uniref:DinB superfamily protein n=1 Tax=Virgibacillus dokdonensis TaxID=302167 RepID=A0A3E0WUB5_9BACI|nr:hypothetical protein [Virgibacillus dokdonensis]RFA35576.1 hypothetical protein CAI16_08025 [Virgibacillus dokdonensis]
MRKLTCKYKIINHQKNMIQWGNSLGKIPHPIWFQPIEDGKWSVAEIISHFIPWDKFVINAAVLTNAVLCPPPDRELMNKIVAIKGRKHEQSITIKHFLNGRERMFSMLEAMKMHHFEKGFSIGGSKLTICTYLDGLVSHDLHHKAQINGYINRTYNLNLTTDRWQAMVE